MKTHKLIDILESRNILIKELGLAIIKAVYKSDKNNAISMIKAMDKHFQKKSKNSKKTSQVLEKLFQTELKPSV